MNVPHWSSTLATTKTLMVEEVEERTVVSSSLIISSSDRKVCSFLRLNKSDEDLSLPDKLIVFKKSVSVDDLKKNNKTDEDIWKLMLQKESRYSANNIHSNQVKLDYKMKITAQEIFINGGNFFLFFFKLLLINIL